VVGRLLRILVVLLAARLVWSLLVALAKSRARPTGAEPVRSGELVRDPVCGVYVLRAGSFRDGDVHFCSSDCRVAFREKRAVGA